MQPDQMTVILTGACGGIGQMMARRLGAAGASLFLCGRDSEQLAQLQSELAARARPGQIFDARPLDLLDDAEVDRWLTAVADTQQPVNVLINNAGICKFDLFERHSDRDIETTMQLNSIVPMKLTRRLLPMLKRQPQARVVNIASTFGAIGFPGYSVYSASKYAIRGFSQALARELSDTRVRVGCVLPRATKTAINSARVVELNRRLGVAMDPPEKVADAVVAFVCGNGVELALGWPEKLLVRVNSLFPALIGNAISKKLPLIKQHAG